MDEDQELKHVCKFCSKSFPCGRSLGGHMRSHLITVPSSSSDHNPKKKLPPLVNGGQLSYTLRENPRKTNKSLRSSDEDALLQAKFCKECGKSFNSWKALFGHMKCHSVTGRTAGSSTAEEDSWNSSSKPAAASSQSDNEGSATLLLKKKRSKRYTTSVTNSSSLTIENYDQHEQEEVALSLIILSRDKGSWGRKNSAFDSSDNSSDSLEAKGKQNKLKTPQFAKSLQVSACELNDHSEVNSPRKSKSRKRKAIIAHDYEEVIVATKAEITQDLDKKSKFTCSICKKGFPSYQALGGHRASHKKFKGSCDPTGENCSIETAENSPSQTNDSKEHECPICFRVFSSGQALGGHKRSHLIADQAAKGRNIPSVEINTPEPEGGIRNFLDLNLPAPVEEECSDFKPWWLGNSHKHEPLLGLLSS